jgi:regulator of sirC expression with transglutaminase-like and TPR domain
MPLSFAAQMARPDPGLDELALALAGEFGPVDARRACDRLVDLGDELRSALFLPPPEQCTLCSLLLAGARRLRLASTLEPRGLLVDHVLERGEGHPLALALVYSEAARMAGIPLLPAGDGARFLVAHAEADEEPLVLDPAAGGRRLSAVEIPDGLKWLCPHEIGFQLLACLRDTFELVGDLEAALRAAEIGLALPLSHELRHRLLLQRAGILARLN